MELRDGAFIFLLALHFLQIKLGCYLLFEDNEISLATQTCLLPFNLESKPVSEILCWVSSPLLQTKVYISKTTLKHGIH